MKVKFYKAIEIELPGRFLVLKDGRTVCVHNEPHEGKEVTVVSANGIEDTFACLIEWEGCRPTTAESFLEELGRVHRKALVENVNWVNVDENAAYVVGEIDIMDLNKMAEEGENHA